MPNAYTRILSLSQLSAIDSIALIAPSLARQPRVWPDVLQPDSSSSSDLFAYVSYSLVLIFCASISPSPLYIFTVVCARVLASMLPTLCDGTQASNLKKRETHREGRVREFHFLQETFVCVFKKLCALFSVPQNRMIERE